MSKLTTIRDIVGLSNNASPISQSALIIIDAQNTYCEGIMQLEGVEAAIKECRVMLDRFRNAGRPIFHIQHDAGPGTPYDVSAENGQIVDALQPQDGESVIVKNYPNSFVQTELDALIKQSGNENLILTGFMSHMCVNSTARGAFSLGYNPTVVASATATRALPAYDGSDVPAEQVQRTALTALLDMVSAVVPSTADVPD